MVVGDFGECGQGSEEGVPDMPGEGLELRKRYKEEVRLDQNITGESIFKQS